MAENKSVVGYGGEKSSDAESKLSRCETRVAGAVSDDPTDGAPWRWRIIAMLFGLSMGGELLYVRLSWICDDGLGVCSWEHFFQGDVGSIEEHACEEASHF